MERLEFVRLPAGAPIGLISVKRLIKELVGYATASSFALAFDMLTLWILVHYFSVGYLLAATSSYLAGACIAYTLSMRLAFKQHRLVDRRVEFLGFVALGTVGLAVNAMIMTASVKCLGLHYLTAKCVAACFTFICNFATRRQLLFVPPAYRPVEPRYE